jgi:hypothetical protein
MIFISFLPTTNDHRVWRTGLPVRSAVLKPPWSAQSEVLRAPVVLLLLGVRDAKFWVSASEMGDTLVRISPWMSEGEKQEFTNLRRLPSQSLRHIAMALSTFIRHSNRILNDLILYILSTFTFGQRARATPENRSYLAYTNGNVYK